MRPPPLHSRLRRPIRTMPPLSSSSPRCFPTSTTSSECVRSCHACAHRARHRGCALLQRRSLVHGKPCRSGTDRSAARALRNPVHAKAQPDGGVPGQPRSARPGSNRFSRIARRRPKDPATYTNLATLEMQAGNPRLASRYFAEALTIDPRSGAARQGLAELQNR